MDDVQWTSFTAPCTGTPNPGNIVASANPVCPSTTFVLSLQNSTIGSSVSYQWQSSPDSITWASIAADTLPTLSTTLSTPTFFRAIVTCGATGLSDTTGGLQITINPVSNCYCVPGITDCTGGDEITNLVFAGINDTTTCGVTNGYTMYQSPMATVQQGVTYPIAATVGSGGTEYVSVWIDYNQNGVFEPSEYNFLGSAFAATITSSILVPNGALLGTTLMRVRVEYGSEPTDPCSTYTFGETQDYFVNVLPAPPCAATPVGGVINGSSAIALGLNDTLIVTGSVGVIQWQISSVSATGPFTNITGAHADTLITGFSAASSYWLRVYVTGPGCNDDSSAAFQVDVIFHGDNVCDAVPLNFGWNGPFSTVLATTEVGEPVPPATGCQMQNGWCSSTIANTLWFSFVAPASGRINIHTVSFDTKLAVWSAASCNGILNGGASLLAANDDDPNYFTDGDAEFSSWIDSVVCLSPGTTYYVQLAPYSPPGDTTSIVLTDLGPGPDPSFALAPGYCVTANPVTLTATAPVGVFSGPGVLNGIFYPNIAGVGGPYTITFTLNSCVATANVLVGDTPIISLVDTTGLKCHGDSTGSVKIHVSGGSSYSYLWSTSQTGTDSIGGLPWGYYSVIVKDNGGCSALATYILTEPATSISIQSTVNNQLQGSTGAVTQTVSGGIPPYTYQWSNGATTQSLANVPAGIYTSTITDANGCVAVTTDTVRFISGIKEIDGSAMVSIFPNPTPNRVFIDIELNHVNDVVIEIYDMSGRLITSTEEKNVISTRFDVNLENEATGVYMAKIKTGSDIITRRIVVNR